MTRCYSRRQMLRLFALGSLSPAVGDSFLRQAHAAHSRLGTASYGLEFPHPLGDLIGDLLHGERGDPQCESATPHHEWYSEHIKRRLHAWGPKPRLYPPLADVESHSSDWRRERVIATAARFLGYSYQHHHIPDWDPPRGWPWKETCAGHNGKGVDCSNFTSFVYNQGFGIKMSSAIERQARIDHAFEEGFPVEIKRVDLPADYQARVNALRTGDLLYIRGREDGPITHVVLWVGPIGRSASNVPLVMDSHGSGVKDDEGRDIPCGIQLRPFREKSWYGRCASHAHRVFFDS